MLSTALFLALSGVALAAPNNQHPGVCKQGIYGALSSLAAYEPAQEFCLKEFGHQDVATVTTDSHKSKRAVPSTTKKITTSTTKCTTTTSAAACKPGKCHGKPHECMLSTAKCQEKEALKTLCSCIVPKQTVTVPCKTTSTTKKLSTTIKSTTKCTTTSNKSTAKSTTKATTTESETTSSTTKATSTVSTSQMTTSSSSTTSSTTSAAQPAPTCSAAENTFCFLSTCATKVSDGSGVCLNGFTCKGCTADADCTGEGPGYVCVNRPSGICNGSGQSKICAAGSPAKPVSTTTSSATTMTTTSSSSTTTSSTSPAQPTACSAAQAASCPAGEPFCGLSVLDGSVKCTGSLYCQFACTSDADCSTLPGTICATGYEICGPANKVCAVAPAVTAPTTTTTTTTSDSSTSSTTTSAAAQATSCSASQKSSCPSNSCAVTVSGGDKGCIFLPFCNNRCSTDADCASVQYPGAGVAKCFTGYDGCGTNTKFCGFSG